MKKLYRIVLLAILLLSNLSLCSQKADDYRVAANRGDAEAQFNLGLCYYEGNGVAQDYKQAVYWWTKVANQGNAAAQYNLGLCYEKGYGVAQDYKQTVYWYTKSANQGLAAAQFGLGLCYGKGDGVAQDYKQAVYWYTKAANQGLALAQLYLGNCYDNGNGVAQDYKQAVYWYTKAVKQGNNIAQGRLGRLYEEGNGVGKNIDKAIELYTKAADEGDAYSQIQLGFIFETGKEVPQDYAIATKWFTKVMNNTDASELEHLLAEKMLSFMTEREKTIAEKKKTLRFNETNVKDCNIADLVRHPLGNTHINPITLTKREFKAILKEEYPNLNVKEEKCHFYFRDDQIPSHLVFRGKRINMCSVDFYDKELTLYDYYFTFDCDDYSEEDVMAFTEIICDELKKAGASLEKNKLGEYDIMNYNGKLEGNSIYVSMTKYKGADHYDVHLSTFPNHINYSSSSSSSTSSYKGKYSRWPYYYSNPIYGFRLGYVQRSLRVSGYDLDEPVHIDMFGEENDNIPGFQLGFLFDPSDWLNMGMFGLNMGVNFEIFFNKWDAAPSNHYDKYMEMNLNFPLDLTFHIPFSSESALYLHGGLAIDWGIYNRLTYSRNSNIEPLTDVFCKHWIDNLNLSYEYGVDLRMKAVMLSLNYQKGFYGHPVFENYTTTIDKLSLGLSFVF